MADDAVKPPVAKPATPEPVDWDALEREAGSADEREWLHWERALDAVARDVPVGQRSGSNVSTEPPTMAVPTATGPLGTWGKYVLRQKVGEGGFGAVFRAWDPMLEHEVAIKVLHRRVSDASVRKALLLEGRALARIVHQNVVRVLAVETQADQMALCMEFVHGETLEELVRRQGTLNAREAALIGEEVCRALAAVHNAGFIHRDVKARNVMRQQAGRIVLMDFGAGRHTTDLQVPGLEPNVGTPLYMAPELLAGEHASEASDVYSVGVLLYFLVTGSYPVEGRTLDEVRAAHLRGRRRSVLERRADLPTSFVNVIDKALSPDPDRRYSNAGTMLAALSSLTGTHMPAPATRWHRMQGAAGAIAGSMLLLGAIGMVTSLEFTAALGHAAYVHETPLDWLWWGIRASLGPVVTVMLVAFACALVCGAHRVVVTMWRPAARLHDGAVRVFSACCGRFRLDDPHVRGAILLLVAAGSFVAAWLYFNDFVANLLLAGNLWSAPAEKLRLLAPANRPFQWLFRKVFIGELIGSAAVLALVWRFRPPTADVVYRIILAGAAAITVLTLLTVTLPYRVLYHADFDVVRWNGAECYLLGRSGAESLLFCPSMRQRLQLASPLAGPPPEPVRHGENVFTSFGS